MVLITMLIAGCSVYEPHTVVNDGGEACLFAAVPTDRNEAQLFANGATLTVSFYVGISTCDRDAQAWCGVTRDGNALRIDSLASWIPWHGQCSRELASVSATCESDELDAGTYTVVYGSATTTLTVPSSVTPPCLAPGAP
jgi:hypothetical protein